MVAVVVVVVMVMVSRDDGRCGGCDCNDGDDYRCGIKNIYFKKKQENKKKKEDTTC